MCRSSEVVKIMRDDNLKSAIPSWMYQNDISRLVMLVGDASSYLVYQRGLNKAWQEVVKCAQVLSNIKSDELNDNLADYSRYCVSLYEKERDRALVKHDKIMMSNKSTSATGIILASTAFMILSVFAAKLIA